ncbi:transcription elongation factor SPT4-like [Dendronephthya gigantea]|uniref:transcription elongation factor SPT4-like n=1 Tax=Dendronephthya gigantea TaxID=151771 RepID=UPI00106D37DA|nr:transcription elongation factor SPT4-like [Dendronephthya gigantea]
MAMETVPRELRGLRACLLCSLIKTSDQFEYDGCDNCEKFLRLKGSKDNISNCTSSNFDGIISLISGDDSWVARWQRIDNMVPGCYAVSVTGKLPMHIIRELKARGVDHIPRDRSQQL